MIQDDLSAQLRSYWRQRARVPGAFEDIDFLLFDRILRGQEDAGVDGDLLEIGAFMGKSAIVAGLHARSPERMIVCDVFQAETADVKNNRENNESYTGLSRQAFETNYHRFVPTPPIVVHGLSSTIRAHVRDGSVRFAHVDGSHLHDVVQEDLLNVRELLNDQGVVAFDDYRALHTPGVAAAVWGAVAQGGLMPICLSDAKFYATWNVDVAESLSEDLRAWFRTHGNVRSGTQRVAGNDLVIVANPRIWTARRRVRAVLPPVMTERLLQHRGKPHLGN